MKSSKYYKLNRKLQELQLKKEIIGKITALLVKPSKSEPSSSELSEKDEPLQIDELATSTSSSSSSESEDITKQINMLTKDQELILDILKHVEKPQIQKEFLDKLLKSFEEKPVQNPFVLPSTSKNTYDLTTNLGRQKSSKQPIATIQCLQEEIKAIKN